MNPVSRVNYFSGEALLTRDFKDEQDYHKQMRERLSRGLLTPGIIEGFDVEWTHPATQVTVRAGTALDRGGRLIVLAQDTPYTPTLVDGQQNFLTVCFDEQLSDPVSNSYGQGDKRWIEQPSITCNPNYDPGGPEILIAVIAASGGAIQSIYYYYGNYMRRHVGATLQSVDFVDERNARPWPAASIALNQDTLEIEARKIELDGAVTANNVASASGTFSGNFKGTFVGDGTQLTLPKSTNYWTRDANDNLYYNDGNVAIGDTDASGAHLTVRQGNVPPKVATGLISLQPDGVTVLGYQTRFESEVKVGDLITYDYAPEQVAIIVNVNKPTELEIADRFPIDLGPSTYHTQRQGEGRQTGVGKISACGTTVTCTNGTFPQNLGAGDTLILDASREDSQKCLRVKSVDSDNKLTVVAMAGAALPGEGPKLSAFSGTRSVLLAAGGTQPPQPDSPQALSVAQNGTGGLVPNSVGINVDGGALSGQYALEVRGACQVSRWPIDPTESVQLLTVGGTATSQYQGLSVTDNGASAPVGKTVSINVDTVDPQYALDVSGPCRVTSLEVSSDGAIKAASEIDTDKIGPYTAQGPIEVTGALIIDKTIAGKSQGDGLPPTLAVAGNLEVRQDATVDGSLTVDGTLTVDGALNVTGEINGKLHNPIPGPLIIDGPFSVTNGSTTADGDLFVHGDLHVNGALTTDKVSVNKHNAQGDQVFEVTDDGDLNMAGNLSVGPTGNGSFTVSPDGVVKVGSGGSLAVGGSFDVSADGYMQCFGHALKRSHSVAIPSENFLNANTETDGFIVVETDPDTMGFESSAEIVVTVSPQQGDSYAGHAVLFLSKNFGRAGASTTVPVPKGSSCSFTAKTTSGNPGNAVVTITWIPLGNGSLSNLAGWP